MGIEFSAREISALYGLIAEDAQDFIVKTDRDGFILAASPSLDRLGLVGSGGLIGPHLLDLVEPTYLDVVRDAFRSSLAGRTNADWIEAPLRGPQGSRRWFAMRLRSLEDRHGETYGVLAVLRSVEERRALEQRAFAARITDPLTGIANRCAFTQMLSHLIGQGAGGSLAIFDIDRFRAINLEYGQAFGDEVLRRTADTLRAITRPSDILARIGSEKFAVLMPGMPVGDAQALGPEMLLALGGEVGAALGETRLTIGFRCGIAPFASSLDETMKTAELALVLSRAAGCIPVDAGRRRRWQSLPKPF